MIWYNINLKQAKNAVDAYQCVCTTVEAYQCVLL